MTKKTIPCRWIDTQSRKHSPAETLSWIQESWQKSVLPEFRRFREALADANKEPPSEFFVTNGIRHGNKNPLFLFLKPSKLLSIVRALESIQSEDDRKTFMAIFRGYLDEWHESIESLRSRLPSTSSARANGHMIQQLIELARFIYKLNPDSIDQSWFDKYSSAYLDVCQRFSDMRFETPPTRQIVIAVKEALKESAFAKWPTRHRKHQSPERIADKADIAKIVGRIKEMKDKPQPGQARRSVSKALRILKLNPTYGPIIKRLSLSDNTWKKYVANSRKLSRSKG